MSVGIADLQRAVESLWDEQGLSAHFTALWEDNVERDDHDVLREQEAAPGQPLPYCVVEYQEPVVVGRMTASNGGLTKRHTVEVHTTFRVFARRKVGYSGSPKQIVSLLVEQVLGVFGGHPTSKPHTMTLTHGKHLLTQFLGDSYEHVEQYVCEGRLRYRFLLDIPTAVPE